MQALLQCHLQRSRCKGCYSGSTNSTSATTVQKWFRSSQRNLGECALTINSGTGALSIRQWCVCTNGDCCYWCRSKDSNIRIDQQHKCYHSTIGFRALNITSTNGAQTHNSGTGVMAISNDATNNTVNVATVQALKLQRLAVLTRHPRLLFKSGSGALAVQATNVLWQ